jgi:hypothetical protein
MTPKSGTIAETSQDFLPFSDRERSEANASILRRSRVRSKRGVTRQQAEANPAKNFCIGAVLPWGTFQARETPKLADQHYRLISLTFRRVKYGANRGVKWQSGVWRDMLSFGAKPQTSPNYWQLKDFL